VFRPDLSIENFKEPAVAKRLEEVINHFTRGFVFGDEVPNEVERLLLYAYVIALTVQPMILFIILNLL
jgi:hypothetical protein